MKTDFWKRAVLCVLAAALCLAPLHPETALTVYASEVAGEADDSETGGEAPGDPGDAETPAEPDEPGELDETAEPDETGEAAAGEEPGEAADDGSEEDGKAGGEPVEDEDTGKADVVFTFEDGADAIELPEAYSEEELHFALLAIVSACDESGAPVDVSVKAVDSDEVFTVLYEAVHPRGEVFLTTWEVRLADTAEELGLTLTSIPEEINYGKRSLHPEETLFSLDDEAKKDLGFEVSNLYGEAWSLILLSDSGFVNPADGSPVEGLALVLVDSEGEIIHLEEERPLHTDRGRDETASVSWDELDYDIQVLAKPGLEEGVPYEAVFRWGLVAE